MNYGREKVYVVVGNNKQNGFRTLEWALQKWNSHYISIVILHVNHSNFYDLVSTPFGKLPASSISEEKLEVLKKYEEHKIDELLSSYVAFCGKVKAGIHKVENKYNQPPHKLILNSISELQITKLVIEFTFMKSSSWRSKNAVSGSFYVHEHKPEFCQLFIVCSGKLVFLRGENDEEFVEDDGVIVAKLREKGSLKGWIEKMLADNLTDSIARNSPSASLTKRNLSGSQTLWEYFLHDIENYYKQLCSSNLDEEANEVLQTTPPEQIDTTMSDAEKTEYMRSKIDEAQKTIDLKQTEGMADVERQEKAEWASSLCNKRAKELDSQINEEISNQIYIKNEIQTAKKYLSEIQHEVEETKRMLNSLLELQPELSYKFKVSSESKSNAEAEIEIAIMKRLQTISEIDKLRQQRDVFRRRLEYCKDEKLTKSRSSDLTCGFKEYTAGEIRSATDDFSERLRLKSSGDLTNVYRGRFNNATVAIKMLDHDAISQESFESKVKMLTDIRHPHFVAMIGFCSELRCIVVEYMHNGSLRDLLFSSDGNSGPEKRVLQWHDRIRMPAHICTGLGFLHLSKPRPISHGNLSPSNILLDRNLVAKINFDLGLLTEQGSDILADIRALGVIMLNLLTGRNWAGLVEEAMVMGRAGLVKILDQMAGQWPMNLAEEFAGLAIRCLSANHVSDTHTTIERITEELDELRKKSDDLMAEGGGEMMADGADDDKEYSSELPSAFVCPIFKEAMKNPHVAEDGFSYELEAIEEWLKTGHNTSPMTNLQLKHNFLTPNHTLHSLIQDWHTKQSITM